MQLFTPKQYLMIDIANSFGLDKETWDNRLSWFKEHENHLIEMLPRAENPAMYFAGVQAWEEVLKGNAIGYPISLDATSSGLQILAALTGDRKAAQLCNVVDTGNRNDAYSTVYSKMLHTIGERSKISRDDCKDAIMTALYGSRAVPKEVFGDGLLLKVFYDTMQEVAPAAWELNEAFLSLWNPDAYSHDWVLPDNFHVHVKVMNQVKETVHFLNEPFDTFYKENSPTKEGRSLGANCVHSIDGMIVREITRRCDYDPIVILKVIEALECDLKEYCLDTNNGKMVEILMDRYNTSGYLSARILDYLDVTNIAYISPKLIWDLIRSLPEKPFKVIAVHDCFRVLPGYGNDLRKQYNLQLSLIAKSNLLEDLLSQITGKQLSIGKLDPILWKDALDSNYSLS